MLEIFVIYFAFYLLYTATVLVDRHVFFYLSTDCLPLYDLPKLACNTCIAVNFELMLLCIVLSNCADCHLTILLSQVTIQAISNRCTKLKTLQVSNKCPSLTEA
jgi:hypothetical protein